MTPEEQRAITAEADQLRLNTVVKLARVIADDQAAIAATMGAKFAWFLMLDTTRQLLLTLCRHGVEQAYDAERRVWAQVVASLDAELRPAGAPPLTD